ncbi:hypothetical protein FE257_006918 [Aspergillus nanangensis]|uniref:Uncharacterized protein n=1 Tax=Aspergillus nanangensis TaxID=2582783 RepID=A0AAD4GVU3_ASPNN|nr:hypothetical protein FE257_006918 [Aspergillus nanangensis]
MSVYCESSRCEFKAIIILLPHPLQRFSIHRNAISVEVDMLEILLEFGQIGVFRCPFPVLPDFGNKITVNRILSINSSTWVFIPVPNSIKVRSHFHGFNSETSSSQLVQEVYSSKTRADDQNIQFLHFQGRRRIILNRFFGIMDPVSTVGDLWMIRLSGGLAVLAAMAIAGGGLHDPEAEQNANSNPEG